MFLLFVVKKPSLTDYDGQQCIIDTIVNNVDADGLNTTESWLLPLAYYCPISWPTSIINTNDFRRLFILASNYNAVLVLS